MDVCIWYSCRILEQLRGKFVHEHTHREPPLWSSQLLAQLQINCRPINSSPALSRLQLIRLWPQKLYHRHRWSAQLCPRYWWEGDRVIVLWLAQQRGRFRRLPVKYNYRVRIINDQWRNTVYPRKCLKDWDSKVHLGWNQAVNFVWTFPTENDTPQAWEVVKLRWQNLHKLQATRISGTSFNEMQCLN